MSEKSKVSIIIPVYNAEQYIGTCLKSVLQQSYRNLEIIVVDDGSEDSSKQIIEQFVRDDSRVVFLQQINKGVSNARNAGIKAATGEYLTFVDGDDYIGVDYIYELVKCAESNQAQLVICGLKMVDTQQNILKEIIPGKYIRYEHEEWTFRLSVVAAHLYRKELWDTYRITFYEGERGEDIPIALFFSGICERIVTLDKAEYYYLQHNQSAMHNFKGLTKNRLPYCALEETIIRLQEVGIRNNPEFHELFVLRILATFVQMARGAEKDKIIELDKYINHILDEYYPQYYRNRMTRIFAGLDIPFFQRVSVKILIWVKRMGILSGFLRIVCR